jgi:lipoprotein
MKKLMKIMSICSILLLMSCNKPPEEKAENIKLFIRDFTNENNYYSSNYAKEGNDYYYINIKHEERYKNFEMKSIPSKYIVGIDSEYEIVVNIGDMEEYIEYIPTSDIKKTIVSLYDIESGELEKTIDIKEILDKYGKSISNVKQQYYDIVLIDEEPYIGIRVYDINHLPREIREVSVPNQRILYVNLLTKQCIEEGDIPSELKVNEDRNMKFLTGYLYFAKQKFFVSVYDSWEGVVEASADIDKINENHKKLYEKFPDLKEKIDKLKREKKDAELVVVLTGDPSYEEIMEVLSEEGQEYSFNDIVIKSEDSVDGMEHQIHSFDEWRKYYRVDEVEGIKSSPIIPRE